MLGKSIRPIGGATLVSALALLGIPAAVPTIPRAAAEAPEPASAVRDLVAQFAEALR